MNIISKAQPHEYHYYASLYQPHPQYILINEIHYLDAANVFWNNIQLSSLIVSTIDPLHHKSVSQSVCLSDPFCQPVSLLHEID